MRRLAATTDFSSFAWIVVAATVVALARLIFVYAAVLLYVVIYPVLGRGDADPAGLRETVTLLVVWGNPLLFFFMSGLAAYVVARRAGEAPLTHGLAVGVVAAVIVQATTPFVSPPVKLSEVILYLLAGAAGGLCGGAGARRTLVGYEALYDASREISEARRPDAVAAAIGENLGGSDAESVALWWISEGAVYGAGRRLELRAVWPRTALPAGAWLDSQSAPISPTVVRRRPAIVRVAALPEVVSKPWTLLGLRKALLVPMAAPGGRLSGLLMVGFRSSSRLSRITLRLYLTAAEQAALALRYLRLGEELTEERRRTAEEAGVRTERQRLAREMHDTVAHALSGVVVDLAAAEEVLQRDPHVERGVARKHVERALDGARKCLGESRRVVYALRSEVLEGGSLPEALERVARTWSERTGVPVSLAGTGSERALEPDKQHELLRVTQEALNNVEKHAGASRVSLTLSYMEDLVVLDVLDDGVGFETHRGVQSGIHAPGGFGLDSMRQRVERLGGRLLVESESGKGTAVVAELPAREAPGGSISQVAEEHGDRQR